MAEQSKQYVVDLLHVQFLIVVTVCKFSNLFHNCDYPLSEGIVFIFTSKLFLKLRQRTLVLYGEGRGESREGGGATWTLFHSHDALTTWPQVTSQGHWNSKQSLKADWGSVCGESIFFSSISKVTSSSQSIQVYSGTYLKGHLYFWNRDTWPSPKFI